MSLLNEKINNSSYGNDYRDHYFEQYKMYLQGIEKISDRRENANKYFVTLNSGIIVAISFLVQHHTNYFFKFALFGVLILGIILSFIFFFLINSYKQLNTAKFKVLHEMENYLPMKTYSEEWNILGHGKEVDKYFPFSHIERLVPVIFGAAYLIAFIYFVSISHCF